ncbi:AzlD domain-containing protein [Helicobacter sp. 16-1353]|uniref:branched-chain amino acid transporter permease n=1 Tax=Helicobacter sp. 16-1353 TaxID=2004996 RepID=UPI0015EEBE4D|nr:AzlD domain-containing protein [Helicobacter sp. 16-1353]
MIILVIAIANLITRFLPYFIMPKKIPAFLDYISNILPNAIIAMLVVYCLRYMRFEAPFYGIKEIIGVAVVVILHLSIKIPIVSILGGVVIYMLLIQKL